jgi:hypothetical protein
MAQRENNGGVMLEFGSWRDFAHRPCTLCENGCDHTARLTVI